MMSEQCWKHQEEQETVGYQWSISYSSVLLRDPVTDKLAFTLLFSLDGLVFYSVLKSKHRQHFPIHKWHLLLLLS